MDGKTKNMGGPPMPRHWSSFILHPSSFVVALGAMTLGLGGCATPSAWVAADASRYQAMKPVVAEYQANHPETSQTYADLMRAWELSIGTQRNSARSAVGSGQ